MLIESCTDITKLEMRDFYGGNTPLHAAARGGNATVTQALCDRWVIYIEILDSSAVVEVRFLVSEECP